MVSADHAFERRQGRAVFALRKPTGARIILIYQISKVVSAKQLCHEDQKRMSSSLPRIDVSGVPDVAFVPHVSYLLTLLLINSYFLQAKQSHKFSFKVSCFARRNCAKVEIYGL